MLIPLSNVQFPEYLEVKICVSLRLQHFRKAHIERVHIMDAYFCEIFSACYALQTAILCGIWDNLRCGNIHYSRYWHETLGLFIVVHRTSSSAAFMAKRRLAGNNLGDPYPARRHSNRLPHVLEPTRGSK
ncbi:Uncharacterised protein [Chlamydia trachomatis]|nr:Uncharacterised protein [Chlamydia trachomatis]